MAAAPRSILVERLQGQRVTKDGSTAQNVWQISSRNVPDKVSQTDQELVLPVQEVESPTALKILGWLQTVLAHRQAKTAILIIL